MDGWLVCFLFDTKEPVCVHYLIGLTFWKSLTILPYGKAHKSHSREEGQRTADLGTERPSQCAQVLLSYYQFQGLARGPHPPSSLQGHPREPNTLPVEMKHVF